MLNDRPRKALGYWMPNEALRAGKGAEKGMRHADGAGRVLLRAKRATIRPHSCRIGLRIRCRRY